jgi:hypothetical protein
MTKQERRDHFQRMAVLKAEVRAVVATGVCPRCGTKLRRNLALTGWWQCGAYGEPGFRRPEDRDKAHCEWQGFTE